MKTALVTGANRGLGLGFADVLASKGYTVYAGMRHTDGFKSDSLNIKTIELDVQNDVSIQSVVETIRSEAGSLDLLVNNAGVNKDTATGNRKEIVTQLSSLSREALLLMFNVNSVSPLLVMKYMVPIMTSKDSFIINISSQRASFSDKNESANYGYRASKVALNMFTIASLFDLPKNVQTFAVHPGSVKTDMNPWGKSSAHESATSILCILDNWQPEKNGKFLNYDGADYPL